MKSLSTLIDLATEVSILVQILAQPHISKKSADDVFERLETRSIKLRAAAIKMEKIWEVTPEALKTMLSMEEFNAQVDIEDEHDPLAADPEFIYEHQEVFKKPEEESDEEPIE